MAGRERDRIVLYEDEAGDTRWRYRAAGNRKVMADSGEGYREASEALEAALRVTGAAGAPPAAMAASAAAAGGDPLVVRRQDGSELEVVVGE